MVARSRRVLQVFLRISRCSSATSLSPCFPSHLWLGAPFPHPFRVSSASPSLVDTSPRRAVAHFRIHTRSLHLSHVRQDARRFHPCVPRLSRELCGRPVWLRPLPLHDHQPRRLVLAWCVSASSPQPRRARLTRLCLSISRRCPPRALLNRADQSACDANALVGPGSGTGNQDGTQGDGVNPTNAQCVVETESGAYFCGIAGAACTSDANCDNGHCVAGTWCVACSFMFQKRRRADGPDVAHFAAKAASTKGVAATTRTASAFSTASAPTTRRPLATNAEPSGHSARITRRLPHRSRTTRPRPSSTSSARPATATSTRATATRASRSAATARPTRRTRARRPTPATGRPLPASPRRLRSAPARAGRCTSRSASRSATSAPLDTRRAASPA